MNTTADPTKFALITSDDWEALYVNGKSVAQDHSFSALSLLKFAEIHDFRASTLFYRYAAPEDEERCLEEGQFPLELSELQATLQDE